MAKNQSEYALHLHDRDGNLVSVMPGDEIPSWAEVTNPYVLGKEESESAASDGTSDGPPPRAGKGSGEPAWRKYAEDNGVDVSGLEGRDDIIAAVDKAGVPVE